MHSTCSNNASFTISGSRITTFGAAFATSKRALNLPEITAPVAVGTIAVNVAVVSCGRPYASPVVVAMPSTMARTLYRKLREYQLVPTDGASEDSDEA